MKRGEVRWVTFAPPDKRRPAVILTRTSALGYLSSVTVAPLTTTIREAPSSVRLGMDDGLPQESVALLHSITNVPQASIDGLIGVLSESKMRAIEEALLFALGMERYLR